MKLTRCEQGHFYDGDRYDSCPCCSGLLTYGSSVSKVRQEEVQIDEEPEFLVDMACRNGHFVAPGDDPCPTCVKLGLIDADNPDEAAKKKKAKGIDLFYSKFARCENGHTYNQELYDRCPICEEAEREKRKKQPRMDIMRCEKGHFYNREVNDSCPYCRGEALKENGLPDEKQQNGQEENLPDKSEPSARKEKLIVNITYCEKGHYYDGELYDACPYCGKQEDESSSDGSFEFFGRPDNRGMYHVEFWDVTKNGEVNRVYGYTTVPPKAGGRPALEVKKCRNGHYFDGNREKVCPYCGDAAAETIETI